MTILGIRNQPSFIIRHPNYQFMDPMLCQSPQKSSKSQVGSTTNSSNKIVYKRKFTPRKQSKRRDRTQNRSNSNFSSKSGTSKEKRAQKALEDLNQLNLEIDSESKNFGVPLRRNKSSEQKHQKRKRKKSRKRTPKNCQEVHTPPRNIAPEKEPDLSMEALLYGEGDPLEQAPDTSLQLFLCGEGEGGSLELPTLHRGLSDSQTVEGPEEDQQQEYTETPEGLEEVLFGLAPPLPSWESNIGKSKIRTQNTPKNHDLEDYFRFRSQRQPPFSRSESKFRNKGIKKFQNRRKIQKPLHLVDKKRKDLSHMYKTLIDNLTQMRINTHLDQQRDNRLPQNNSILPERGNKQYQNQINIQSPPLLDLPESDYLGKRLLSMEDALLKLGVPRLSEEPSILRAMDPLKSFRYGNRPRKEPNQSQEDPRLEALGEGLFRGKKVLDLGCGAGAVALHVSTHYRPHEVRGVDLDGGLVKTAVDRLRNMRQSSSQACRQAPLGASLPTGPVPVSFLRGRSKLRSQQSPSRWSQLPLSIDSTTDSPELCTRTSFAVENVLSPQHLAGPGQQYDLVLCLSLCKWVQLNWGDAGLVQLFTRVHHELRPEGRLVVDFHPWKTYSKSAFLCQGTTVCYSLAQLKPADFGGCLQRLGFELERTVCDTQGEFSRSLYLYKKLS